MPSRTKWRPGPQTTSCRSGLQTRTGLCGATAGGRGRRARQRVYSSGCWLLLASSLAVHGWLVAAAGACCCAARCWLLLVAAAGCCWLLLLLAAACCLLLAADAAFARAARSTASARTSKVVRLHLQVENLRLRVLRLFDERAVKQRDDGITQALKLHLDLGVVCLDLRGLFTPHIRLPL